MGAVLVTGAASGIGQALTRRLLQQGTPVIASALALDGIEGLAAAPNLHRLAMDVGDCASVDRAFAEIDALPTPFALSAIVNAAGVCPLGTVEFSPIDQLQATLNVNTLGSARLLRAGIPRLRATHGRIVLISSLWGRTSGPMLSAYAASKHAIEALADSARRETQDVDIVVVEPGVVQTGMLTATIDQAEDRAANLPPAEAAHYQALYIAYAKLVVASKGVSAEACAAKLAAILAAPNPRPRYRVGTDAAIMVALARLLPDRALDRLFRAMLKPSVTAPRPS